LFASFLNLFLFVSNPFNMHTTSCTIPADFFLEFMYFFIYVTCTLSYLVAMVCPPDAFGDKPTKENNDRPEFEGGGGLTYDLLMNHVRVYAKTHAEACTRTHSHPHKHNHTHSHAHIHFDHSCTLVFAHALTYAHAHSMHTREHIHTRTHAHKHTLLHTHTKTGKHLYIHVLSLYKYKNNIESKEFLKHIRR